MGRSGGTRPARFSPERRRGGYFGRARVQPPSSSGPLGSGEQEAGAESDADWAPAAGAAESAGPFDAEDGGSSSFGVDSGVDSGRAPDEDGDWNPEQPFQPDFNSGAGDDGEEDFDMDAENPLGPAPMVEQRRPQPESERKPLASAVSGALGGLGAAGGGDRRSRLMGIAGVLLIVVGIITAVLAVVVGLNRSGDTTVPIAAADTDPAAEAAVESQSAVAGIVAGDEVPGDTPAATPGAAASDAEAPGAEAAAAQPPVVAPSKGSSEEPSPETDGSGTEAPSAPDNVAEAEPVEKPAATVEEAEAPAAETPSDEVAVEAEGPEAPVAEEPPEIETPVFVVPDGPAPDYGWVSYWPQTQVYAITQGDTITSLAEQFDTHPYAIICLNTQYWFDSPRLFTMAVGDALVIPTGYTIPGDDQTLYQYLLTGFLLRRCG